MCADPVNGNYALSGTFTNGNLSFVKELKATNTDIYVAYYTSAHAGVWALALDLGSTSQATVTGCAVSPVNGDVTLSFHFNGAVTINGTSYTSNGGSNITPNQCAVWVVFGAASGTIKRVIVSSSASGSVVNRKSFINSAGETFLVGSNLGAASVAGKTLTAGALFEGYLVKLSAAGAGVSSLLTSAGSGSTNHIAQNLDLSYDAWSNQLLIAGECRDKSKTGTTAYDCGFMSASLTVINPTTLAVVSVQLITTASGSASGRAVSSDNAGLAVLQGTIQAASGSVTVGASTLVYTGTSDSFFAYFNLATMSWVAANQIQSSDGVGVSLARDLNGNVWGGSIFKNTANLNGTAFSVGAIFESVLYRVIAPNTYASATATLPATSGQTQVAAVASGGSANRAVLMVGNALGDTTFGTVKTKTPYQSLFLGVYVN